MDERQVPLLATQVARVGFTVPVRTTFRVEKIALFCYPASGGTFSSTEIEIMKWDKFFAGSKANLMLHLNVYIFLCSYLWSQGIL
jgi:hypothetical protein